MPTAVQRPLNLLSSTHRPCLVVHRAVSYITCRNNLCCSQAHTQTERMAQWWDEWLLRILVLASLSAQYFLVLSALVRKYHIPPWLKLLLRLAHIGSDALALFAIATLFNHQKAGPCCSYARGSRDLELLWAPILVLHLGGQVVITIYSFRFKLVILDLSTYIRI